MVENVLNSYWFNYLFYFQFCFIFLFLHLGSFQIFFEFFEARFEKASHVLENCLLLFVYYFQLGSYGFLFSFDCEIKIIFNDCSNWGLRLCNSIYLCFFLFLIRCLCNYCYFLFRNLVNQKLKLVEIFKEFGDNFIFF